MLEQEIKNIWNNSSQTEHISIETSQLVKELNVKMSRIQNVIKKRDIREISASVIGMLIFMYLLYEIPFPITKLACVMSIIWFAFIIIKFRKSKTQNIKSQLDLSIKGQLSHQKHAMQYQADLLNSVAYWYAIPPFIINCVFLYGLGNPADYNWTNNLAEMFLPLTLSLKTVTIIGLAFFYGFIIWLSKRAADKELKPLLKKIETIQSQL